jgi:hypothetical protein
MWDVLSPTYPKPSARRKADIVCTGVAERTGKVIGVAGVMWDARAEDIGIRQLR